MDLQKTQNSQNNPEEKKKKDVSVFQSILQSYSN